MGSMTREYAAVAIDRLGRIQPDAAPQWGKLTPPQLLGHLRDTVRYTMGEGPDVPYRGNWKTRYIFRHLIIAQLVRIPRNIRLPNPDGSRTPHTFPDGTLDELRATIDEYLNRAEQNSLPPRVHPYFGVLSPRAWRRFHYAHFEHHLAQFGA